MTDVKNITVNGVPLKAYIDAEVKQEVAQQISATVGELKREVRQKIKAHFAGTGSGRTRGNPGVKRARKWSREEIEEENRRRSLSQNRSDA